ncbi:phage portal protein [Klebsiella pneumoniae]|uniref:Phage portal protein n=1 Tax=Klebsiella pneumoniae TaxID=573 RepID=A0A378FYI7_KLEPN|nr:phage portal protein [Klebsiella pneumoniae]
MEVRLSDNGKNIIYRYRRDTEYADFSQKEIFHLKGFGFNGLTGLSPLAFSAKSAGVAIAMEDNQREFFANGAKSPQILMTDGKVLTKEQRGQLEENFKEIAGGPVKKRLWILESGFTTHLSAFRLRIQKFWLRVNFRSPNWRDFTACLHIWSATWTKPPPGDRGLNSKTWAFSSIPSNPTLIGGSTALSAGWSKSQNRASFTPSITSTDCCAVIQQAGHHLCKSWSTPGFGPLTEVRRLDNLPPLPGGDVATRQSQNVPITDLGTNKEPRNAGA